MTSLGLVGLGRMGGNMRERWRGAGLQVIGYDLNQELSDATDPADLVARLDAPRVIWLMLPVQHIDAMLAQVVPLLSAGDVVVDGGNSKYTDDQRRAGVCAEHGVAFVDCGVSGGVWGRTNGYALMVGGEAAVVERLTPYFQALKPAGDFGFVHAGPVGAGHFAKMVHNGIEYAMMEAYAEGWELLATADLVTDVPAVFRSWREGSVVKSWLLDLLDNALEDDPDLSDVRGYAEDSGEGRWTVEAAIELGVPTPAISASLYTRFISRQTDSPAMKMIAALRNQFGGHAVLPEDD
ncbi:phosphogluconate dehydrogenase (NAD(+)-dependent, decarboxylating) [Raineyella sp. LH-20]|uniref:phosphogluconate dehydrogenase (NAD(+)-dependent, decarboxylating) n=1 Tax=Raineyella sp. LH-20 TaxID=3081204 RepID=UPI0029554AFD|nr:decarboxylating 6-phosphogluconate dehydrogenase [Raineyella sp. LH-20]WOP19598.1 decarboxylating 6-phosphogluconate dehydrogenase [Raineyella sp. LH-20]